MRRSAGADIRGFAALPTVVTYWSQARVQLTGLPAELDSESA